MLSTAALALVMYLVGSFIVGKVGFLRKYYIPVPVVGGLLFALINLVLTMTGVTHFTFDTTLQSVAMTLFFTSVGYMSSLSDLRKGGIGVVLLLICTSGLIAVQNGVGVGLAALFGVDKRIGVLVGSVPYTGGNGTATAWGVTFAEEYGIEFATALGNAAATIGLVMGGLLGGPVARFLATRRLRREQAPVQQAGEAGDGKKSDKLNYADLFDVLITLFICMGVSEILNPYFAKLMHLISPSLTLPGYILSMMLAMITRNVRELVFKKKISAAEIDKVGDIGLQIFLSIALTTLNLATLFSVENAKIGVMLLVSVPIQAAIVCLYVCTVTFNVMGHDYDAAVISCGHTGFAMGATPTAIANMDTFCKKNGRSMKAYLTIPIVGALFLDFANALLISLFIGFFS
jgi:ESS family glutamate:Na+ symporter